MPCFQPTPIYSNKRIGGLKVATSLGDGYTVELKWFQAYADPPDYELVYNIFYSTNEEDIFKEGVKFVVIDPNALSVNITGFKPGDVIYFAVQASEFPPNTVALNALPIFEGTRIYPEAALRSNISISELIIPIYDVNTFPAFGVVHLGGELIQYTSVDYLDGYLLVPPNGRGFLGTTANLHNTDGYDGYVIQPNPLVRYWSGWSDQNIAVFLAHNHFQYPNYAKTNDGYKDKVDVVNGSNNLQQVQDDNEDFKSWDYVGWRRNTPQEIVSGKCIGTYIGGEFYCADGYEGVGRQVRGLPFSDHNNMREEMLLDTTGTPVVLVRRQVSGKASFHYRNTSENTAHRGLDNSGTELVHGYEQFFNPRRSDGKIMVRFGATKEDIKREDPGLENTFVPDCWTLVTPYIKDGDFIVRYNNDGSEEWRYEIIDVTRNLTVMEGANLTTSSGRQMFTAVRVRVTDPIRAVPVFCDRSTMPSKIATTVGQVPGVGGIPPHVHEVIISEITNTPAQINQFTSISEGHNHEVINGTICAILGHQHFLIF